MLSVHDVTKNLLRTFPNEALPPYIEKMDGMYFWTKDGGRYLDLTGGYTAHCIVGWNHERVKKAVIEQLSKYTHADYKMFSDPNRDELARLIASQSASGLDRVFFCGGAGAEACESAIHLSYQTHFELGKKQKFWYISREQSYHGATSDAMSLGDRPNLRFYAPFFSKHRAKIPEHNKYRAKALGESDHDYCLRSVADLERKILEIGPENVGGFVAETIMGGLVGDVPPVDGYWRMIRDVCTRYDIHLIADEVWCGTGTSGKWFCIDHDQVKPDFVFIGKTLASGYAPLSAVVTTSEIEDVIRSHSGRVENSATFQGHSLSIAAALAVQRIVTGPGFLDDVASKGQALRDRVMKHLQGSARFFSNVRGRGLRNSIEYKCDSPQLFGLELSTRMLKRHGIVVNGKWHRICLSPALVVDRAQLLDGVDTLCSEFLNLESEWPSMDKAKIQQKNFF